MSLWQTVSSKPMVRAATFTSVSQQTKTLTTTSKKYFNHFVPPPRSNHSAVSGPPSSTTVRRRISFPQRNAAANPTVQNIGTHKRKTFLRTNYVLQHTLTKHTQLSYAFNKAYIWSYISALLLFISKTRFY
jgi:hypothetical protein